MAARKPGATEVILQDDAVALSAASGLVVPVQPVTQQVYHSEDLQVVQDCVKLQSFLRSADPSDWDSWRSLPQGN